MSMIGILHSFLILAPDFRLPEIENNTFQLLIEDHKRIFRNTGDEGH
jgi:hypothetical protein